MPKSAVPKSPNSPALLSLIRAIIHDDLPEATRLLKASPHLAQESLAVGAMREASTDFYFEEINHYLYAGDTPLHAAAAAYRIDIAKALIQSGADIAAKNRRGAEPLHYAADGSPWSTTWNPQAQSEMIALLIASGANPNALDKTGVAPLHRAVRHRSSAAVDSLLRNCAAVKLKNKTGSTPLHLAVQNTGKGGSGSPESKIAQGEIIALLLKAGANPRDQDGRGTTAKQSSQSDWILALL